MKNTIFAVEEMLFNHYKIKIVVASTAREAREKAKRIFHMQAPKATRLPLKKEEKA